MKNNYILKNSQIKLRDSSLDDVYELDVDFEELGIVNETEELPNSVTVKYVLESVHGKKYQACMFCDEKGNSPVSKRKVKVIELVSEFHVLEIKTPNEKAVFSELIKKVREKFLHNKYSCDFCIARIEQK